jgi:hypothetical protein
MPEEVCLADIPPLAAADGATQGENAFFHVGPLVLLPIITVTVQRACEFSRVWDRPGAGAGIAPHLPVGPATAREPARVVHASLSLARAARAAPAG